MPTVERREGTWKVRAAFTCKRLWEDKVRAHLKECNVTQRSHELKNSQEWTMLKTNLKTV